MSRRASLTKADLQRALDVARQVYGDEARVSVTIAGVTVTIERAPEATGKLKGRKVAPERDFVL